MSEPLAVVEEGGEVADNHDEEGGHVDGHHLHVLHGVDRGGQRGQSLPPRIFVKGR